MRFFANFRISPRSLAHLWKGERERGREREREREREMCYDAVCLATLTIITEILVIIL